jgi:hypothetical protein
MRSAPLRLVRVAGRIALAVLALVAVVVVGPAPTPPAEAAVECNIDAPDSEFTTLVEQSPTHAQLWRLYQAVFLRQPDAAGLAYWAEVRASGASLSDIAYNFAAGSEFRTRYGQLSNDQFVRLVYKNVLCRTKLDSGQAYWLDQLNRGNISRSQMMINFTELREYLGKTGTCHSVFTDETSASNHCDEAGLVPLGQATLGANGYREIAIGGMRAVEVDLTRLGVFRTGAERCSVASINGNWLVGSQKDSYNPSVIGLGVVDGMHVKGSADRTDRGVFGLRVDSSPTSVVEVWPGDTLSPDDIRLNSVMFQKKGLVLEQWHAAQELSPYLRELAPDQIVGPNEWIWAAAGIPLRIDGQTDVDFWQDYSRDPYTYQTLRHTFVAVDQDSKRLVFGGTSSRNVGHLVRWAEGNGYEDLIKFDGGASAELNIGGRAVVAGTSRDIPVWLGIGC